MKSRRLSSTSVRKECLPKKFMKTSWKPLGRSLLLYNSTVNKWTAEFKRERDSIEDDGGSGCPKDATSDENVIVLTPAHPGYVW